MHNTRDIAIRIRDSSRSPFVRVISYETYLGTNILSFVSQLKTSLPLSRGCPSSVLRYINGAAGWMSDLLSIRGERCYAVYIYTHAREPKLFDAFYQSTWIDPRINCITSSNVLFDNRSLNHGFRTVMLITFQIGIAFRTLVASYSNYARCIKSEFYFLVG